ncbi:Dyp-type peroxidase [Psychrobium sp. 1_MG-2023]|uniref:Dyp-type peroxidase n=1 Tax=Psychrobium sp. 1_MG-2023 TaxID=3062624 RepID=UPI000C31C4A6|nr:Dyp-type peroxidase [Psychrobium sp. 1_MG-2023]MDP2560729.1 Dyp-type peroxidase [Psychrobium sp. 1_MG-2023]PKF56621.1 peroxidase [Alteromonadales bacterium alter-6D02]
MAREQAGICAEGNLHGQYLLFDCVEGQEHAIRAQLSEVSHYLDEMTELYSDVAFSAFIAVGANYWDALYPDSRPALLRPFPSLTHGDRHAPACPFDLFIQIRCDRQDINYMVSHEICLMFEDLANLVEELKSFRYLDNRDLTGFVDGTENPKGLHRQEVALVSDDDKEFRGGSYIHIQRYQHDLKKWNNLKVKKQEDIIGRTKQENHEYSSFNKPKTSHIRRTSLKDNQGKSLEILRQSMPYGDMKEQGLFFISCCHTPLNFELMLRSMIVGDNNGHYDHLLKYTQAVTGAAFFAPSMSFLNKKAHQ